MASLSLALLGDAAVGKSALVLRVTKIECLGGLSLTLNQKRWNEFHSPYEPTIEGSYRIGFGHPPLHMDVLDTSGADCYSDVRERCIRQHQGFVLVYDITNRSSFDFVQSLFSTILTIKDDEEYKNPLTLILVGNKSDQVTKREVDYLQGRDCAQRYGCQFFETSAKTADNVEEVFLEALRLMEHQEASIPSSDVQETPSQDRGPHESQLKRCMGVLTNLITQHWLLPAKRTSNSRQSIRIMQTGRTDTTGDHARDWVQKNTLSVPSDVAAPSSLPSVEVDSSNDLMLEKPLIYRRANGEWMERAS